MPGVRLVCLGMRPKNDDLLAISEELKPLTTDESDRDFLKRQVAGHQHSTFGRSAETNEHTAAIVHEVTYESLDICCCFIVQDVDVERWDASRQNPSVNGVRPQLWPQGDLFCRHVYFACPLLH